ncbi:hypothetical protein LCGC14_3012940, partial [marine sediment metagenome]
FTRRGWAKQGFFPGKDDRRALAHYVNIATGRGNVDSLPEGIQALMPIFNATMFSPRLAISRFQVASTTAKAVFTPSNKVSQLIIKDMMTFTGTRLGLLSLGWLGGLWDLELDPTNADFGKIRIGNTSLDPWSGFRPYVTFFARMSKSLSEGDIQSLDDTIEQLARSKLAPVASGLVDVFTGRDFLGRPVQYNSFDLDNLFLSRVTPLIAQDIQEAWQEGEFKTEVGLAGTGAFLGIGTATYRRLREELEDIRNPISQDKFGMDYDDEGMDAAKRDDVDRDPNAVDLEEEIEAEALLRGDDWAENKDEEQREILSIRTTGATTDGTKVTDFTQKQVDDALDRNGIDGSTWIQTNRQISRDIQR